MDISIHAQENFLTSGISYDMRKCFDTIPMILVLQIFNFRGADSQVTRALNGFYKQHHKYFKLEGSFDTPFRPSNGIIQGCPLSMLLLTSMISAWCEFCMVQLPQSQPRSYADDLSICNFATTAPELVDRTQQSHKHTSDFVQHTGMQLNAQKCFTFGDRCVEDSLPQITTHKSQFRLVGASVKLDSKKGWTDLEKERRTRWQQTVRNVGLLPSGWFTKVKIIQSTMSQLTYGQGTHSSHCNKDDKRTMRASVVRCLLKQKFYDSSPGIIFALLSPPSIDPDYALNLAAFMLIKRLHPTPASRQALCEQVTAYRKKKCIDGPIDRIHQLLENPVFHQTMHDLLNNTIDEHRWQHNLREQYRHCTWTNLSQERGQHFRGIENGVQRQLTVSLIHQLTTEADKIQILSDQNLLPPLEPKSDPRPRLKILRLILSVGLQSPERDHRHRRRKGTITCACGLGTPSLFHISWECPLMKEIRDPMLEFLPAPIHELPPCFQFATIVPADMVISKPNLHIIQNTLITIHIEQWYGESDTPQPQPTVKNDSSDVTELPIVKRGHVLKLIPSGGVFCCRCGRSTKLIKHQRLKILSKKCTFPDLPPERWLTQPGFQNIHSFEAAEHELNEKHNKGHHRLIWNRFVGKDKEQSNFGKLWCSACGLECAWKSRHANSIRKTCTPTNPLPIPPPWVTSLPHFNPNPHNNQPPDNVPLRPVPRTRLRGKQSIANQSSHRVEPDVVPGSSGNPSSSSGLSHRRGVG
jgi:hypothetical protein